MRRHSRRHILALPEPVPQCGSGGCVRHPYGHGCDPGPLRYQHVGSFHRQAPVFAEARGADSGPGLVLQARRRRDLRHRCACPARIHGPAWFRTGCWMHVCRLRAGTYSAVRFLIRASCWYARNAFRGKVFEEILHRGIHVVMEKPMVSAMQGAMRIARASREGGAAVVVNWSSTWQPSVCMAHKLCMDGDKVRVCKTSQGKNPDSVHVPDLLPEGRHISRESWILLLSRR